MARRVSEECVAVGINEHMLRWIAKTDGEDGAFIKANMHPTGGSCFVLTTASGKKLAGGGGPYGPSEVLRDGLAKWRALPDAERKALAPGREVTPPEALRCTPPAGGMILRTFTRNLKYDPKGELATINKGEIKQRNLYPYWDPIFVEPAHGNVWITEAEWKSLLPERMAPGFTYPVPPAIKNRIFRYHLYNTTFGDFSNWRPQHVQSGDLTLTVVETSPLLRLRLEGSAILATDSDFERAEVGFDALVRGWLEYDPAAKAFTRFDAVAIGEYVGGHAASGSRFIRPGRTPVGISFELVPGDSVVDRVPPILFADREDDHRAYFATGKE